VKPEDFVALAKNQVPGKLNEPLTVRTKTNRQELNPETDTELEFSYCRNREATAPTRR